MPPKKKQHYVPAFYLKNSASSTSGKSINIFNIRNRRSILNGNLRNQCYGEYFYGKDGRLEEGFAELDGRAAHLIKQILATDKLPIPKSDDHVLLLVYTILQRARTQHAVETYEEAEAKFETVLPTPELKEWYRRNRKPMESVILPLRSSLRIVPVALDLGLRLLINRTAVEFITSDNPVILHNQYCAEERSLSSTGWASSGLQVVLPISPTRCIFMYDQRIYKVGDRRADVTGIAGQSDVGLLNEMQLLNALENVYYSAASQEPVIVKGAEAASRRRNSSKAEVREYPSAKTGERGSLLHYYSTDLAVDFDSSFCKIRRDARRVPLDDRLLKARDPELAAQVANTSENDIAAWLQATPHKRRSGESSITRIHKPPFIAILSGAPRLTLLGSTPSYSTGSASRV